MIIPYRYANNLQWVTISFRLPSQHHYLPVNKIQFSSKVKLMMPWRELGLTTLPFDLFKNLSIHDPKNAQAAMSRIAGRLALHDALKHYRGEKNITLTIIGAGAAGLSAAIEGLKCGIKVQVFGRREALRKELKAARATYYVLPETISEQIYLIRSYLTESNIFITAARTPGKKAPLLIDEESLKILPPKSLSGKSVAKPDLGRFWIIFEQTRHLHKT